MNSQIVSGLWAMAWKEMRENVKWALLGMAGVFLSLVVTIARQISGSYTNSFAVVWSNAGQVMTFGGPLIGLAFGFLQILPEMQRDQWAFLVHRPVPRATLFWAKAVTGMGLTLAASLIPLLILAFWVSAPGHIPAPFDWRLLLGGLASSLAGLIFYAAGLLTSLRPARWYGSRALPVVGAIFCALFVASVPEFWQAALAVVVSLTIFLSAARGSFLTSGHYLRQPQSSKISLGITLFLGIATVLVTVVAVAISVFSSFFRAPEMSRMWSNYEITRSGRTVRVTGDGNTITKATDLEGHGIKGFDTTQSFLNIYVIQDREYRIDQKSYGDPTRYVRLLGTAGNLRDGTIWYYYSGSSQVSAYSLRDRNQIGSIGADGIFSRSNRTTTPLPWPLLTTLQNQDLSPELNSLLLFRHRAYILLPEAQRMEQLKTPTSSTLRSANGLGMFMPGAAQISQPYLLNAGDEFLIYSRHGKFLFRLPRAYSQDDYPDVIVSMTPDEKLFFFHYYPHLRNGIYQRQDSHMTKVAANGAIVGRYALPLIHQSSIVRPSVKVSLYGLLSPPVATAAINMLGFIGRRDDNSIGSFIVENHLIWELLCVLSALGGVVAALLAWRIGRRCVFSRSGQWAWTVGVLWLGLPGVLLLLSLRDWPAREVCANCGRMRVVNRDRCEHCGAEFPPLPRDGTEIFGSGEDDARALAAS